MTCSIVDHDTAVTSLIAQLLINAEKLESLRTGESQVAVSAFGQEVIVEIEKIALFAGFISKVRYNNDLFEIVPGTLLLLRYHGVELATFRDYFLSGRARSNSPETKVSDALRYLQEFANSSSGVELIGLADVLTHERVMWELKSELTMWKARVGSPVAPILVGPIRIVRTRFDPYALLEAAKLRRPLPRAWRTPKNFLYWADFDNREIKSAEISTHSAAMVVLIDGLREFPDIVELGRRSGIPVKVACEVLAALANAGVISSSDHAI